MDIGLKKLNESKPTKCDICRGGVIYRGNGEYCCKRCNRIMYDDYGKVKQYVDKHGTSSILRLAKETGVSKDVLDYLVRDGVLTVSVDEETDEMTCAKCGCMIESGRYCKKCMLELANGITGSFNDAREKQLNQEKTSKMGNAKMHHTSRWRR